MYHNMESQHSNHVVKRAIRLLEVGHCAEMNRLALELEIATPQTDAESVVRRLRKFVADNKAQN